VLFVQTIFENPNATRQGVQVSQPALVKLPLKPYQLASVNWMADIERRVGCDHTHSASDSGGEWMCPHLMQLKSSQSPLLFDVINDRILCDPVSPSCRLGHFSVRVKGGILAGVLGLFIPSALAVVPVASR